MAPDPSEAPVIQQMLSSVKSDIASLDDEITRMTARLEELRQKRDDLQQFCIEHERLLSPIRRLPPELLAEVFILCLPSPGTPSFNAHNAPGLLTQICASWRQVALSEQRLWSSITVSLSSQSSGVACRTWLSRSMSSPLSIYVDADDLPSSFARRMWPAISPLTEYCDRWRDVVFLAEPAILLRLHTVKYRLISLQSLRIGWSSGHLPKWPVIDVFAFAPQLRKLHLTSLSLSKLIIPWSQLTELSIQHRSLRKIISSLRLVQNLVKCTIEASDYAHSRGPDSPIISCPKLLSLTVNFWIHGTLDLEILNTLHCCSLVDISITHEGKREGVSDWASSELFLSFISRSSHCLRRLYISSLNLTATNLIPCLRATPMLRSLKITTGRYFNLLDNFFLFERDPGRPDKCLIPFLEELEIGAPSVNFALFQVVKSRWKTNGDTDRIAHLKKFKMEAWIEHDYFDDGPLHDDPRWRSLRQCQQEGLDITIIGPHQELWDTGSETYTN